MEGESRRRFEKRVTRVLNSAILIVQLNIQTRLNKENPMGSFEFSFSMQKQQEKIIWVEREAFDFQR